MTDTGRVSVVIINFNSGKYIEKCIQHVRDQTYKNIEIIVVDNNSTDGSREKLETHNDIKYFALQKNVGSSRANNLGIKSGSGAYFLILNADVFIEKTYVEESIRCFEVDPRIGIIIGKLLSASNPRVIDTTGIVIYKEGLIRERGMGELDCGQYDQETYVVGGCCAAALYRKSFFETVSYRGEYFSEVYFAFYEDLDVSILGILLGWKCLYTPNSVGHHVRGGSTKNNSGYVRYLTARNYILFLKTFPKIEQYFGSTYSLYKIYRKLRYVSLNKRINQYLHENNETLQSRIKFFQSHLNYQYLEHYLDSSIFSRKVLSE